MLNENVENIKADAKNAVSDIGNIMSHAKADAKADVEKVKAKFGHGDELDKKAAYAKADIKALYLIYTLPLTSSIWISL